MAEAGGSNLFDYPPSKNGQENKRIEDTRKEERGRSGGWLFLLARRNGWTPGPDRKPTIDYQACYYEQRRSFFRDQKLVFNAGFVAFLWPEGGVGGGGSDSVITILSDPMTTRAYTHHRVLEFAVYGSGFGLRRSA